AAEAHLRRKAVLPRLTSISSPFKPKGPCGEAKTKNSSSRRRSEYRDCDLRGFITQWFRDSSCRASRRGRRDLGEGVHCFDVCRLHAPGCHGRCLGGTYSAKVQCSAVAG